MVDPGRSLDTATSFVLRLSQSEPQAWEDFAVHYSRMMRKCFQRLGKSDLAAICLLQAFDSLGSQPSATTTKLRSEIEKVTREVLPTVKEAGIVSELTTRFSERRGPSSPEQ